MKNNEMTIKFFNKNLFDHGRKFLKNFLSKLNSELLCIEMQNLNLIINLKI